MPVPIITEEFTGDLILGALTEYKRFIGTGVEIDRTIPEAGATYLPLSRKRNVWLGHTVKHCQFIDGNHGLLWYNEQNGGYLYDIIGALGGWKSLADRLSEAGGHGHMLYTQNGATNELKIVDTCIFVAGFGQPGKILSTNTDRMQHYRFRKTAFMCKTWLIGSGGTTYHANDIEFEDCSFVDCSFEAGYLSTSGRIVVHKNLFAHVNPNMGVGAVNFGNVNQRPRFSPSWESVTFTENMIISGASPLLLFGAGYSREWTWDHNVYHSTDPTPFHVWLPILDAEGNPTFDDQGRPIGGIRQLTFEQWQDKTGFDQNSFFYAHDPESPIYRIYPVPEQDAANIVVVNTAGLEILALPFDASYYTDIPVREVRDWETTYDGIGGLRFVGEVAKPMGWDGGATEPPMWRETLPCYGIFRLENIMIDVVQFQEAIDELIELRAQSTITNAQIYDLTSANEAKEIMIADLTAQLQALIDGDGDAEQIVQLTGQLNVLNNKITAYALARSTRVAAEAALYDAEQALIGGV